MIIQALQIVCAWFFGFYMLSGDIPFPTNFCICLGFLFLIFLLQRLLTKKNIQSVLFHHLKHKRYNFKTFASSFSLFLISFVIYTYLPSTGIIFSDKSDSGSKNEYIDKNQFEIKPAALPFKPEKFYYKPIAISCYFILNKPINTLLFYTSYGEAVWRIDGVEYASHTNGLESRYLTIFKTVLPGIHRLDCSIPALPNPFPLISISVSPGGANQNELHFLQGPFFTTVSFKNVEMIAWCHSIALFLLIAGLWFFIPFLSAVTLFFVFIAKKSPKVVYFALLMAGITLWIYFQTPFYENGKKFYEADEAAFGIMGEFLLEGQSPPLYHYGQDYQGTLETFILAPFLAAFSSPAEGLHILPQLFYILFLAVAVFSFCRYGSPWLGCFALFILGTGGLHLHWIFSKTWFGYSFSLLAGSILFFIAFESVYQKTIRPGLAVLWGIIAGLSLYSLTLSIPFVFFTFLLLFTVLYQNRTCWPGFVLAVVILGFFIFPYFFSMYFHTRQLPAPRVAGENKLLDRFLGECLPVLLGVRSPFNEQDSLASSIFASFPVLSFLCGVVFYPYLSKNIFTSHRVFSLPGIHWFFYLYLIFIILLVSFSPYGIWPWYAIPLYYVLPVLFYVFIKGIFSFSPGLSTLIIGLYFLSTISAFKDFSYLYQQPSSLSLSGFSLPPDFAAVKKVLQDNSIHHVICDQGWDTSPDYAGKDWVGECLIFDSRLSIAGADRLSRRVPGLVNETIEASRIGYLFHENYIFNYSPSSSSENFVPLAIENLEKLFGPDFLDYKRFYCKPYIVFIPISSAPAQDKHQWKLESSNPIFMKSAFDQNISVRIYGKDAYWSTGEIPEAGAWMKVDFPAIRTISKIIVFHGTKWKDHSNECKITFFDEAGKDISSGLMVYDHAARSSVLRLDQPVIAKQIQFSIPRSPEKNWWTAYEIWVY